MFRRSAIIRIFESSRLADEGYAAAQFVYGDCLRRSDGVDVDDMQGCEYLKQSGDGGNEGFNRLFQSARENIQKTVSFISPK
jgi:TPR repeat protein